MEKTGVWKYKDCPAPSGSYRVLAQSGSTYYVWAEMGEGFASDGDVTYMLCEDNLPKSHMDPNSKEGKLAYDLLDCLNYLYQKTN